MQNQTISMSKRKFRIGDLAQELKLKKYIIRFWEKEFNLSSDRSDGGQRFYTEDDLNLFLRIKNLLYVEGYTIVGARNQLGITDNNVSTDTVAVASEETITPATTTHNISEQPEKHLQFLENLGEFKKKLLQIKETIERL